MPQCTNYHTALETRLRATLATKEALLVSAYATYSTLITENIESYKFDSNEGAQQARHLQIDKLKDQIDSLESEIDSLYRRLCGRGIVNLNLRRKRYPVLYGR